MNLLVLSKRQDIRDYFGRVESAFRAPCTFWMCCRNMLLLTTSKAIKKLEKSSNMRFNLI